MAGSKRRVGVMTSGGDCPGLNTAIRAVVLAAVARGWEVLGIYDSFSGLMAGGQVAPLTPTAVHDVFARGGTILGTTNRGNPFHYPETHDGQVTVRDRSAEVVARARELGLSALFVIGGDGSMRIAARFGPDVLPIIGIPKTIDNDLPGTDISIGFDSAVTTASLNIDRLHTTAESHDRVMVVEVMGRDAGWIALWSGLASAADVILIPELPFDLDRVATYLSERRRLGAPYSVVVVAEGAVPVGGQPIYQPVTVAGEKPRLGGIGQWLAERLGRLTQQETRATVLGYIQRGGEPTPFDRVLATRLAVGAVELAAAGGHGQMIGLRGGHITATPIATVADGPRLVEADSPLVRAARELGICLG